MVIITIIINIIVIVSIIVVITALLQQTSSYTNNIYVYIIGIDRDIYTYYMCIYICVCIHIYGGCKIFCDQVFIWIVLAASLAGTLRDSCGTQAK